MSWLFIIAIIVLAIPIAVLSIAYYDELTTLERLELYTIDAVVSLTDKAENTCNTKVLDDEHILYAIKI